MAQKTSIAVAQPEGSPPHVAELTHASIWAAIDRLAADQGVSASALAIRSGLDATAFNPSKRLGPDGRPRWPSTESIARILDANRIDLERFSTLITGKLPKGLSRSTLITVPTITTASIQKGAAFDRAGHPMGTAWTWSRIEPLDDTKAYAVTISDNAQEPAYLANDTLVVSPAAGVSIGHRVIAGTSCGLVLLRRLVFRNGTRIELGDVRHERPSYSFSKREVLWMHRIVRIRL